MTIPKHIRTKEARNDLCSVAAAVDDHDDDDDGDN
jgi:hypothetical protein